MHVNIHPDFSKNQSALTDFVQHFEDSGDLYVAGKRNTIKIFPLDSLFVNVKSFRIPNLINRIAYRYFRKSKARRSFEFADRLTAMGIGTPQPIAFAEEMRWYGLYRSFYACEHLQVDLTFRELVEVVDYPEYNAILEQCMYFCYQLHEKGVEFLDHSPGNTLIKKVSEGRYAFYLVDLNRMKFHTSLDFETRMRNLSHLTPKKEMVRQMSAFYAQWYKEKSESEIFESMWQYTASFQKKFHRKISIKKKLKFWK